MFFFFWRIVWGTLHVYACERVIDNGESQKERLIRKVILFSGCRFSQWWSLRRYAIVQTRFGVAGTVAGNRRGRARSFACADSHGN